MATISRSFAILAMAISFSVSIFVGCAVRVPFHSQNLPNPITKNQNITDLESVAGGYYYITSLFPYVTQTWEGECFQDTYAYVTYSPSKIVGFIMVSTSNARSTLCSDSYEFKVGDQTIAQETFFFAGLSPHEVYFDPRDVELRRRISANGVAVYMWRSGLNQKEEASEEHPQPSRVTNVINVDEAHSKDTAA